MPTSHQKIRLGKDNDGGYIMIDGLEYDCIITAGISNDVSFERDLAALYPDLPFYMYDDSIHELPDGFDHGKFYRDKIGFDNILRPHFDKYNDIFIKMDIEGWENHWLPSLSDTDMLKIKQFVVEWHGISFSEKSMQRFAETHDLVHVHANNYGGFDTIEGLDIPRILECTYVRKGVIAVDVNTEALPGPLDQPNNKNLADLSLNFEPFVYGK